MSHFYYPLCADVCLLFVVITGKDCGCSTSLGEMFGNCWWEGDGVREEAGGGSAEGFVRRAILGDVGALPTLLKRCDADGEAVDDVGAVVAEGLRSLVINDLVKVGELEPSSLPSGEDRPGDNANTGTREKCSVGMRI